MLPFRAPLITRGFVLFAAIISSNVHSLNGEEFLVRQHGYALLGPDGEEVDRLETITSAAGALSPDGKWIAFSSPGNLVIQSRLESEQRTTVPLVWGHSGSSFLPIWSSNSSGILICEQGHNEDGSRGSAYRVYDLADGNLSQLNVPAQCWVNDWSADGKRLLTTARPDEAGVRIAWVNADGTGAAQYVTTEDEVAYNARLSPDGRKILCTLGPKVSKGERSPTRLCVIDLSTNERTTIDEPGVTHGYCWSADGSQIAYTWQRSLENAAEVAERETLLITCNTNGSNGKIVTRREYEVPPNSSGRSGIVFFFEVLDWR